MKFYCLVSSAARVHNEKSLEYLQQACAARNIEFVMLEAHNFDYSQDMSKVIETPAVLYRLAVTPRTAMLEAMLVREGVTTLHQNPEVIFSRVFPWSAALRLERAGLPIIPTVFNVSIDQDEHLPKYVEKLDGFPVILKASGGSHGASVLRLDSIESLRSVLGFVTSGEVHTGFVLRKFIRAATHLRMVVVGDKVVDAIRYFPQPDDFRTNAVTVPKVEAYPKAAENQHYFDLAAESVKALGLEFGGVDLLIDEKGDAYIAEVNFPCNFARNQMNTGVDIGGMVVDYLVAKSQA